MSGVSPVGGVSDAQLAVLLRQTQWALDEAAYDFPAGRVRPQRRAELAGSLEALAEVIRASVPVAQPAAPRAPGAVGHRCECVVSAAVDSASGTAARVSAGGEWELLQRIQGAEVTLTAGGWCDRGRNRAGGLLTGDRAAALDGLWADRCVVVQPPDPGGHRLVLTTVAGEIRYAELLIKRGLR